MYSSNTPKYTDTALIQMKKLVVKMSLMAPIDIIKMSTHNGAKMLHILDSVGNIEVGKYADLILLNQNPLETIKNTLAIERVIKGGKVEKRIQRKK